MEYVALLRGVNVGTARKVAMPRLRALFEGLGFDKVESYINSGNVMFSGKGAAGVLRGKIEAAIKAEFGFEVAVLVKTRAQMRAIARAIPAGWSNDDKQRTDVAYLFEGADEAAILAKLPFNREVVDSRYVKGAVIWNLDRKNYSRSRLNKLIGSELYRAMTLRNVNTARFLAGE
ncbi:MAG: hypothetical protein A2X32_09130 [Elusimicrobia bacterium GWC2_64_44]|nr:MAG: hypothetical protein A2X32_09130 [Elusimicrobia bacterium GWC2_64_44]